MVPANSWSPSSINSPHEGVGGGRPNPRKSSAVSVVMPEMIPKGSRVITGVIAFGSICRKRMRIWLAPKAREARTYVCSRNL